MSGSERESSFGVVIASVDAPRREADRRIVNIACERLTAHGRDGRRFFVEQIVRTDIEPDCRSDLVADVQIGNCSSTNEQASIGGTGAAEIFAGAAIDRFTQVE